MSTPPLMVRTPEELAVAIPHMLGFTPQDSLVVFAVTPDSRTMLARVDLPRTRTDRLEVAIALVSALDTNVNQGRRPAPNARLSERLGQTPGRGEPEPVTLLCFSEDRPAAELACRQLDVGLGLVGLRVGRQLLIHSEAWVDLKSGELGRFRPETANRFSAEWVGGGRRMPAASREELAASYRGDPGPVAVCLPQARRLAAQRSVAEERQWLTAELDRHAREGRPLSDADAARALIATGYTVVRDAVLFQTTPDNAVDREAFWADLTRRAPDHLRAPVASLAAFSAWQAGNGAAAWCALDRIPVEHRDHALAGLMTQVLTEGVNPSAWFTDSPAAKTAIAAERARETGLPAPSARRHRPGTDRPDCGRDHSTPPAR